MDIHSYSQWKLGTMGSREGKKGRIVDGENGPFILK